MKLPVLLLFGLFWGNSLAANVETLAIHPFVKGSFAEIKQQRQGKPFVLIFWSESCSYCLKEMALFAKHQKKYPHVELVTVATDSFLEEPYVTEIINRSGLNLTQTWVFAEQFPERIYADVNKRWRGELPATHFFSRNNQEIRHMGIVKEDELVEWLTMQSL